MRTSLALVFLSLSFLTWGQEPVPPVVPEVPARAYFITEANLKGFEWSALGLKRENFIRPMEEAWMIFFDADPELKGQTRLCDPSCRAFFNDWEAKSPEEVDKLPSNPYLRAHWIKVVYDLEKTPAGEFRWQGRVTLVDVKTKRAVMVQEISPQKIRPQALEQKAINSDLASAMYRSPLPIYQILRPELKKSSDQSHVQRLIVSGQRHLADLQGYLDLLKSRGNHLGLTVKIDSIRQNQVEVLAFYQGEEKSFTDVLSQLNEVKLSKSYAISHEPSGPHVAIKMVGK